MFEPVIIGEGEARFLGAPWTREALVNSNLRREPSVSLGQRLTSCLNARGKTPFNLKFERLSCKARKKRSKRNIN